MTILKGDVACDLCRMMSLINKLSLTKFGTSDCLCNLADQVHESFCSNNLHFVMILW